MTDAFGIFILNRHSTEETENTLKHYEFSREYSTERTQYNAPKNRNNQGAGAARCWREISTVKTYCCYFRTFSHIFHSPECELLYLQCILTSICMQCQFIRCAIIESYMNFDSDRSELHMLVGWLWQAFNSDEVKSTALLVVVAHLSLAYIRTHYTYIHTDAVKIAWFSRTQSHTPIDVQRTHRGPIFIQAKYTRAVVWMRCACVCVRMCVTEHLQAAHRHGLFALDIVSCCFGFCLDASKRHLVSFSRASVILLIIKNLCATEIYFGFFSSLILCTAVFTCSIAFHPINI